MNQRFSRARNAVHTNFLGPAGDGRGFFIFQPLLPGGTLVMKDRGHVGIFLARHGIRFCQRAGSRSCFSSASSRRAQCGLRREAASSALACSKSRARKAVRNTTVRRPQAVALASAEVITDNGTRASVPRLSWRFGLRVPSFHDDPCINFFRHSVRI